MHKLLILLAGLSAALACPTTSAFAAGAVGCESFLWPLATELAWIRSADSEKAVSGAKLAQPPAGMALELALQPAANAAFAAKPTSTPKPEDADAFGGVVTFDKIDPGHYQVTLSAHGWIDVVQNGAPLEATAHTGSTDCDAIRKSVRFEIGAGPFAVQVNGARKDSIRITIRPAAD
jgi:hypothetical protein